MSEAVSKFANSKKYFLNDHHRELLAHGLELGMPLTTIAKRLQTDAKTLRKHYPEVFAHYDRQVGQGRPGFEPSDQQREVVRLGAAVGQPHKQIAALIGIDATTLERHFAEDLLLGKSQANFKVGGNLYKMATGPTDHKNTAVCAIWWSKAQMGWKDVSRVEQTGPDGKPIQTQHQVMVYLPDNGRGDSDVPVVAENGEIIDQDGYPSEPCTLGDEEVPRMIEDASNALEERFEAAEGD